MRSLMLAYSASITLLIGVAYGISSTECLAENGESTIKRWGTFSDIGILVFTGVLVGTTFIQIVLWRRANRTAEAALSESKKANEAALMAANQTKRSVDAYMDTERGMLSFDGMYAREVNGVRFTYCRIENVGKSAVEIMHLWDTTRTVPREQWRPRMDPWQRRIHCVIAPGKKIGSTGEEGFSMKFKPRQWEPDEMENWNKYGLYGYTVTLVYRTHFGVVRRCSVTGTWTRGEEHFAPMPDVEYTFDIVDPQQEPQRLAR